MPDQGELLTTAQVLEFLQIGRTKLWDLVRARAFPAYRLGGPNSSLRYRRSDIMHWLDGQRVDAGELAGGASELQAVEREL